MGCNSCEYLNEELKKQGVCGCLYYCSKRRSYVNGARGCCEEYSKDYSRKTYVKNEIYEDGKKYYGDSTPIGVYIIFLIIFVFLGTLANFLV